MVFAQTSGNWIRYYEDEDGTCFYRSDVKTDRNKNHYVWLRIDLSSQARMELTNDLNSKTPIQSALWEIQFDSRYELAKPVQFFVLSQSGKTIAHFNGEGIGDWEMVKDAGWIHEVAKRLKRQSNITYEEYRERPQKANKESIIHSGEVYNKLLAKIREKQIEQTENASKLLKKQEEQEKNMPLSDTRDEERQDDNRVFDVVEEMPQFPGGPNALFEYLSKNMKYPTDAEENGIQGRVIVTFIVERDGSITNANIIKSVDPSLDKEAYRLVRSMPHWVPGKQSGSPVRVKYTVPITFRLQ